MSRRGGDMLHKAYWKSALWLTAGITLLALLAINTYFLNAKVEHLVAGVAFSLLSAACFTGLLKKVTGENAMTLTPFLVYATARLLTAVAVIGAYMVFTGLRGRALLPFVLVFSTYFILLDALDAWFMMKAVRDINQQA
ncbi:MAG: hypothetical protein J5529_02390 [Prevotella sp.]|nr:hypothetical protein [Prevotella sp.]